MRTGYYFQDTIHPFTNDHYGELCRRMHGSGNQRVEVGVAFIAITPSDAIGGICTSSSCNSDVAFEALTSSSWSTYPTSALSSHMSQADKLTELEL